MKLHPRRSNRSGGAGQPGAGCVSWSTRRSCCLPSPRRYPPTGSKPSTPPDCLSISRSSPPCMHVVSKLEPRCRPPGVMAGESGRCCSSRRPRRWSAPTARASPTPSSLVPARLSRPMPFSPTLLWISTAARGSCSRPQPPRYALMRHPWIRRGPRWGGGGREVYRCRGDPADPLKRACAKCPSGL